MKILVSAYACRPNMGSEPSFGWNVANGLAEIGYEVWCATATRNKESIESYHQEVSCPENLHIEYVDIPGWLDKKYGKSQLWVYAHYLEWQRRAYRHAKKLHKNLKFDLVHHITYGSIQLGSRMGYLQIPFIYGPLGGGQYAPPAFKSYFYEGWASEKKREFISNLLLRYYPSTKHALRNANLVLATNQETYEIAEAYGARNVELQLDTSLPASFAPNTFPKREESEALRILWVGRFFPRKGLTLVLEALRQVKDQVPFTFTIVGDGPMRPKIEELISTYELGEHVVLRGRIPWEEVKEAYLSHDIFMFCSLRDSFGAQLLEAMAFGLTILTLNHHGAGAFVPENAGLKVSVDNPAQTLKELSEALVFLYENPEKRIEMGKQGYEFARHKTWKNKVDSYREIYNKYDKKETVA